MICDSCGLDNAPGVPFCDRCGSPIFKKTRRLEALKAETAPAPAPAAAARRPLTIHGRSQDPKAPPPQIVLVKLPSEEEVSRAQAEAAADVLGVSLYEARLKLSSPLPQILGLCFEREVVAAATPLHEAGVPVFLITSEHVEGNLAARRPEQVVLDGDELIISDRQGLRSVNLRGELLLLKGRIEVTAVTLKASRTRPATRRVGALRRPTRSASAPTGPQRIDVWHLYDTTSSAPIIFSSAEMQDFGFLKETMQPTTAGNFLALGELLASGGQATVNESLFKHAAVIRDSVVASAEDLTGARSELQRSTEPMLNLLSRVLFQAWWARAL